MFTKQEYLVGVMWIFSLWVLAMVFFSGNQCSENGRCFFFLNHGQDRIFSGVLVYLVVIISICFALIICYSNGGEFLSVSGKS